MRTTAARLALALLVTLAAAPPARAQVTPPPDARFQYQLQASRSAADDATGRVDLDVCEPAYLGGGDCVAPTVFAFDLYLDRRGGWVDDEPNALGVDAVRAAGGYAVCYVDAGGIEEYRPDYQRFLRWHRQHGRSLLGKPFSRRFPDERWANVGGAEQRRFLLGMMERRVEGCESAGFDAVDFDVVDAYAAGRQTTGGRSPTPTSLPTTAASPVSPMATGWRSG